MKLIDWDWDAQAMVPTDYPDAVIAEFLNWLRTTKAWHDNIELVHRKLRNLNTRFAEHRQALKEGRVTTVVAVDPVAKSITLETPAAAPKRRPRRKAKEVHHAADA